MTVYACGQCGGPLDVTETEGIIVCNYCGFSNELSSMQEELEQFRSEVKSWLSDLGVVGQAGVDVGMRRLYFHDEIYPDLCTSLTNIVGDTDVILDYPLLYLSVYSHLPDLAVRSKWSVGIGKPMKEFSRRLESPELTSFAPDAKSRTMLLDLKIESVMIPMLMDIVNLSSNPVKENLERCSNTLSFLADEVSVIVGVTASDAALKQQNIFYTIMERRLRIASESYRRFMDSITSSERVDKSWRNEAMREITELRASLKGLSKISVIDRVPMDYGLGNDARSLLTWDNMIDSFLKITEKPYPDFVQAVHTLSVGTFFHRGGVDPLQGGIDVTWFYENIDSAKFAWFMGSLCEAISAENIRIIKTDGHGEFLYPFYLLKIETILRSGSLWWKKGEAEDFHALCDGAFNLFSGFYGGDYPSLLTPSGKKIIGKDLEGVLDSLANVGTGSIPSGTTVLPPTVSPQDAVMLYLNAHNFREEAEFAKDEGRDIEVPRSYKKKGFDPGRVKAVTPEVVGLYYIPMRIKDNRPEVLGEDFELECELRHRTILAREFTSFLNAVK